MDRNAMMAQLQAEAQRRFSGQPASNAGMRPNPSASMPMKGMPMQGGQGMMSMPESMYKDASNMMNGARPGASKHIENALIKRMHAYPPV